MSLISSALSKVHSQRLSQQKCMLKRHKRTGLTTADLRVRHESLEITLINIPADRGLGVTEHATSAAGEEAFKNCYHRTEDRRPWPCMCII